MINGRLSRGCAPAYCACAVDVIPLVPPLSASRAPAHIAGKLSQRLRKRNAALFFGHSPTCPAETTKRPGKAPGLCCKARDESGFQQRPEALGNGFVQDMVV